jgi:hypothetical protein
MIDIDGERVKLDAKYKGTDELLVAFAKALTQINNHFDRYPSFRLKWAEKYTNKNKATGKLEPKAAAIVRFESEINIGMGNHVVNYYENKRVKDNETIYVPHSELFDGNMIFTRKDTERLAYYLVCEPRLKSGMMLIENIEEDATKLAVTRGQNADLLFYIYSDASPLDEARMRVIAYNWGIDITKFATLELLKNQLYNTITTEEGRKPGVAIAEFKKQTMGLTDEMKAVSLVSQGIYKKIIGFNHAESAWFWKGDTTDPILRVNINDRGDEMQLRKRLAQFLIVTKKLYQLQDALGVTDDEDLSETSIDIKLDKFTDFEKLSWVELKRALKKGNVAFDKTDKMPRLIELCKEAFGNVEP